MNQELYYTTKGRIVATLLRSMLHKRRASKEYELASRLEELLLQSCRKQWREEKARISIAQAEKEAALELVRAGTHKYCHACGRA